MLTRTIFAYQQKMRKIWILAHYGVVYVYPSNPLNLGERASFNGEHVSNVVSVIGGGYSLLFNVLNKHFTGSLFPAIVHIVVNAAFSYCWTTPADMLCRVCKLQNHRVLRVERGVGVNIFC